MELDMGPSRTMAAHAGHAQNELVAVVAVGCIFSLNEVRDVTFETAGFDFAREVRRSISVNSRAVDPPPAFAEEAHRKLIQVTISFPIKKCLPVVPRTYYQVHGAAMHESLARVLDYGGLLNLTGLG